MITKKQAQNFINSVIRVRETLTDEQALNNLSYFPVWKENRWYSVGYRVLFNDTLYRVKEDHTSSSATPDVEKELYELIVL